MQCTSERLAFTQHRRRALDRDHRVPLSVSPCMQPSERHSRQRTGHQPPAARGRGGGGRTDAPWKKGSQHPSWLELAVVAWRKAVFQDVFGVPMLLAGRFVPLSSRSRSRRSSTEQGRAGHQCNINVALAHFDWNQTGTEQIWAVLGLAGCCSQRLVFPTRWLLCALDGAPRLLVYAWCTCFTNTALLCNLAL